MKRDESNRVILVSDKILIFSLFVGCFYHKGHAFKDLLWIVCITYHSAFTMVITYVYAKNNAPQAGRGFLNDVQNINSNCDITL